jgi:hypothetical protein
MKYLKVDWHHENQSDPTRMYIEIDDARWERRKVEMFADGRMTYASPSSATGDSMLGLMEVPSIDDIRAIGEFDAVYIEQAEFMAMWFKAIVYVG